MRYFFAPVIVVREDQEDVPAIVISVKEQDEDKAPRYEEISLIMDGSGFVVVTGCGDLTSSSTTKSSSNEYHDNINSGDSIEVIANEPGTLGIFLKGEETLIGVTAGHVMEATDSGSNVIQPSLHDFKAYIDDIRSQVACSKTNLSISMPSKVEERPKELEHWTKLLAKLQELKGESDDETRSNLVIGKTVKWEMKSIKYKGRRCYSDWGTVEILDARQPNGNIFHGHSFRDHPREQFLKSLAWKSISGWSELEFDQYVRKTGRITGLTYGFMDGVHTGWKNPEICSKEPCSEFYVLQELEEGINWFTKRGDSGAAVITNNGELVGFVHCVISVDKVLTVCHPEKSVPDLRTIRERRDSDGGVDHNKLWFTTFNKRRFVLVESALMVKKQAGLSDEIVNNS
jgi:hypothetical protein